MAPHKVHVLFCLCCGLSLAHPFSWQSLNPIDSFKSACLYKIQALMMAASLGHAKIPEGHGPYSVGCTDLMVGYTNESTFLRLYYPSQVHNHPDTIWIPNRQYFGGLTKFLGTKEFVGTLLWYIYGSTKVSAKWNAPLRTGEKYPLIVFSHGLGAFRTIYAAIGVDLASHGFIVAAVEHRDGSASATYYFEDQPAAELGNKTWLYFKTMTWEEGKTLRKKQVQQRAQECSRALSLLLDMDQGKPVKNELGLDFDVGQLKDSIDRNKIAAIGHSFGGATIIQTLSEDHRFRCGIALDPWMFPVSDDLYSKISQPLFFINSERFQTHNDTEKMRAFFLPGKERKMIAIRGSVHQNFADFTFATGRILGQKLTLKGDLDSGVVMDLNNKASLAFLQKYLGLQKDFDQWDPLMEGDDANLIPGFSPDADTTTTSTL
ncbi:platelet-activating factor acetylhydrolase isoform X2 [Perognathus longimembris pacificus]|uniref:platelet-activating factor acetylhydrolase isoform X2 n=1 Tax=Perognathus longimembris pacificus TaxID=214514 RepID=UPI0020194B22|nr:platelet-activating factor acetylhydrolase isoform X2 [Perognathus longimembris pacificus]